MHRSLPRLIFVALGACLILGATRSRARAELPVTPELATFYQFVQSVDFAEEKIGLTPKTGDGSSAYFTIQVGGKTWGAILPDNATNFVHGEILSFNLARAVGRAELFGPAALHVLKGPALARFATLLRAAKFDKPAREANRQLILQRLTAHPDALETVLKLWGPKPYAYDAIVAPEDLLNESDPFARFLKADQPQPTSRLVSLPGIPGTARECDLADQLSTICLVDALAGQADRFSGGNLHAIVKDGTVQFVAYDNGGTWGDERWLSLYLSWVTRFDRQVAQRIIAMEAFLSGRQPEFQGCKSEDDLQTALGLEDQDTDWEALKHRLSLVAKHLQAQTGDCYFKTTPSNCSLPVEILIFACPMSKERR